MLDIDSTTRHLSTVGDVVDFVPIHWITEEIVSSSLLPYNPATDDGREGGSIYQSYDQSD